MCSRQRQGAAFISSIAGDAAAVPPFACGDWILTCDGISATGRPADLLHFKVHYRNFLARELITLKKSILGPFSPQVDARPTMISEGALKLRSAMNTCSLDASSPANVQHLLRS